MIKFVVERRQAQEEETQEERPTNLLSLIGYTPSKLDKSGQFYKEISFWQVDVEYIEKNKELRRIVFENRDLKIHALGQDNRVIRLHPDRFYFGDEYLFIPKRLLKRKHYRVTESDIEQLAFQTRDLAGGGYMWENDIPGIAPTRELMEKAGIPVSATHSVLENKDLMARSAVNNDPFNKNDSEEFYTAAHCNHGDCPIHRPIERFVEEWCKASIDPKTGHPKKFFPKLIPFGTQLDSNKAKELDLREAKKIVETMGLMTEVLLTTCDLTRQPVFADEELAAELEKMDQEEVEAEQKMLTATNNVIDRIGKVVDQFVDDKEEKEAKEKEGRSSN